MGVTAKSFFAAQGYWIAEDLLTPSEVDQCRREVQRLHEVAGELDHRGELAASTFQREPYLAGAAAGALPVLRKIENTGAHSPLFFALAAHPRLVPIVQELLASPDVLLFRSTLMLKPAFHGSIHGLHQDSAYWPMEPPALVTVSIALDDSSSENGCIRVIPGSHTWGLLQWGRIARGQDEALTERTDLAEAPQLDVPLRAGSALFFHSLLVHGSGPNRSPRSRNTALYAYFSPRVRYLPGPDQPRAKTFRVIAGLAGRQEHTLTA